MFARITTFKPAGIQDVLTVLENEVLPILRRQKGFQDSIALASPDGTEVAVMSIWDNRESAEAYERETYPQLVQIMGSLTVGIPHVKKYDILSTTIRWAAAQQRSV